MPGACKSSPVDRPLFTQGPVSPEFIYVPFPIPCFRPSLPLVPEHSLALHAGVPLSPKPWGRETTHGCVEVARTGRFCSPATQIPRDGYYESSFNECDLSFSYFRLGKFPQPTPDARIRFFWVLGPLRFGPSDVIPPAKQFACTSSSICRTVALTAINADR